MHLYFIYAKLTADSPETQIWCSKIYLWFCNTFFPNICI